MATDKHPPVTLSREQLYERVWAEAARTLASQFGLSDVGLAKVCKKHNIPRPPVGYWAKKQFGKAPPPPPLPPCDDPSLQTIEFFRERRVENVPKPPLSEPAYDEDILEMLRRAWELPKVQVAERLTNLHPLVQATREAFSKPWKERQVSTCSHPDERPYPLSIDVDKEFLRRSLLFMDALIKAVEQVGGKVLTEWGYRENKTSVSFGGEEAAAIRLREKYTQTRPGGDLVQTGRLMLDGGASDASTVYCIDTEKGKRIEESINRLIVRWVDKAGQERVWHRKVQEESRRREEKKRIRHERKVARQAELSRVNRLMNEAASWQKSQTIRAYIQAVKERAIREHGHIEEGSELDCWLTWARQQADRLDPLTPSPPSILDKAP